jgi:hypothetical protein
LSEGDGNDIGPVKR